jgi:hypothetical protein
MTASDLQQLEKHLGVVLPADYKAVMQAYPIKLDSFTEYMLLDGVDVMLEANRGCEFLPSQSVVIGSDCGEEMYFIDASRSSSPVFVYDIETRKISEFSPSIAVYVQKCEEIHEELRLEREERAKRKWWQFWR